MPIDRRSLMFGVIGATAIPARAAAALASEIPDRHALNFELIEPHGNLHWERDKTATGYVLEIVVSDSNDEEMEPYTGAIRWWITHHEDSHEEHALIGGIADAEFVNRECHGLISQHRVSFRRSIL